MKNSFLFLMLILTVGCATSYKSKGFGGGYSDYQLSEDMFSVDFRGNSFTSADKVEKMALRRAAEITVQHDFKYFVIVSGNSRQEIDSWNQPGTYPMGNVQAAPSYSNSVPITRNGSSFQIKCFKEKPADSVPAIDANFFLKNF